MLLIISSVLGPLLLIFLILSTILLVWFIKYQKKKAKNRAKKEKGIKRDKITDIKPYDNYV